LFDLLINRHFADVPLIEHVQNITYLDGGFLSPDAAYCWQYPSGTDIANCSYIPYVGEPEDYLAGGEEIFYIDPYAGGEEIFYIDPYAGMGELYYLDPYAGGEGEQFFIDENFFLF
jgi:hypothetical protein